MKFKYKNIYAVALMGICAMGLGSCNDFLDRKPLSQVTPSSYFTSADQMGAYTLNLYNNVLKNSRNQTLYHAYNWRSGITLNDDNTDNLFVAPGNQAYFDGQMRVVSGQVLGRYTTNIRNINWFLNEVTQPGRMDKMTGAAEDKKQFLGEAYFLRAMVYFDALSEFGDFPIVKKPLLNNRTKLIEMSARMPRNEVARFILSDLDKADSLLHNQGYDNNLRLNKQAALLFKSRVALFEGTFEKYHRGTGRVPGDPTWPGKDKPYNKGKNFDIDGEINFFLSQAMDAAKKVADNTPLTSNSGVMEPTKLGQISGFNPYFEMFSSVDLSNNKEVLLWKQYDFGLSITHDAAYILTQGGDALGLTRSLINSFVMKNGLPIYASGSNYPGDEDPAKQGMGRDDRMNLFVFHEGTLLRNDLKDPIVKAAGKAVMLDTLNLVTPTNETRNFTGFRPRKFTCYDYSQMVSNQVVCFTGCPIFRAAEAYLNYIEASYEKNHAIDATADKYWRAIRMRAGVDPDYEKTIAATDLSKEANIQNGVIMGDLAVYSGDKMVDKTLYNIRRERRCEFISEGMRWDDLKRWRSWDNLINKDKMQIEGINLWASEYKKFLNSDGTSKFLTDPSNAKSNMSSKEVSTYIRPLSTSNVNNPLYGGYTFRKAYYLDPLGVEDLTITQTNDKDLNSSTSYQNPYWPTSTGLALE